MARILTDLAIQMPVLNILYKPLHLLGILPERKITGTNKGYVLDE